MHMLEKKTGMNKLVSNELISNKSYLLAFSLDFFFQTDIGAPPFQIDQAFAVVLGFLSLSLVCL